MYETDGLSPLTSPLGLRSTLEELTLYNFLLESDCLGGEVSKIFQTHPLLPGIIITEKGKFIGMISRRRFFEYMSRPYSLELFSQQPLLVLYRFTQTDILVLDRKTSIMTAVRQSLERSPELIHEPIVVEIEPENYQLLDVHQLLLSQLQIHELATVAMRESQAQLRHQAQELELALLELQRTQTQLIQTEKMSSLGQLVAGVAHEINNPIGFIYSNLHHAKAYTEGLMRMLSLYQQHSPASIPAIEAESEKIELDYLLEDLPKVLHSMEQGAERVRDIVLSLRNFCRLDEAQMKQVNIHDGINNTIMLLQSQLKGKPGQEAIAIHKEYSDLPLVQCYPGQLNQVFMNILVNAIYALVEWNKNHNLDEKSLKKSQSGEPKHSPTNTESSISNSTHLTPAIRIRTELIEGKKVIIRIFDNGPGMTEDVRKRLFDPFFTTKPVGQGTGLGLSISYEIVVNQHRGELKCFSAPGQGTEFAIEIPLQQSSPAQLLPWFA
ncbi:ATP-binding protein [Microcoleus sp. bin38.metabat.b11b12b14.051]|uniref:sensor histidine kinase n=1 Tax=Microcoleus sp. bin38.metabat.b11b12b14.051 TaxID=2742709 RepID=UPI0025FAB31B|nr:ATP-binding protein [Microcoleus sp. bin38.metabat.b11b12b14.051]